MGWPEETEDFKTYFPTSFLLTAFDILFFWVSRMVMASLHFTDEVPFRQVYITPLIVDEGGQKMSKSKGNAIDPLELIDEYGADALRLSMAHITGKGRTVRMPWTQLTEARNFLNKIWNMARFVLMHLGEARPALPASIVELEDRYILSRLTKTVDAVRGHLDAYNFNLAAETLYGFTWHDVCDWYIELAKSRLQSSPEDGVKGVLCHLLTEITKLLHPLAPFITEELWQALGNGPTSVSVAPFSEGTDALRDEEAERVVSALKEAVTSVRAIRSDFNVPRTSKLNVLVKMTAAPLADGLKAHEEALKSLTDSAAWEFGPNVEAPEDTARRVLSFGELFVPLAGMIDVDAERVRFQAELAEAEKDLAKAVATLENESFLERAPADVVEKERGKRDEFSEKKERLKASLASLGA